MSAPRPPDLVALLQELVRIPSPNPPGDTRDIAGYVAAWLREAGAAARVVSPGAKPQAASVVATVGQGQPVIMLHAHIDTVPVAPDEAHHWSVDPYAAVIKDGRLYGKGSVDDKAPLAAMMMALRHAVERAEAMRGTLLLVAAAEEEVGGQLGTRWLAEDGLLPASDFIVVGEQTHNRVAAAHKGVVRAVVRTTGRAAHATNPDRGINAITAMAKAVLALDAYHHRLAGRRHPLVGVPTCNVGVIQGGSMANVVPDACVAHLDRRMIPGEEPAEVQAELANLIGSLDVAPAEISIGDFLVSNWFESTLVSPLSRAFLDCVRAALKAEPGPVGYLPGSDAKHLTGLARGEMVIFGPGSYEVAHAYDEYVDLEELRTTERILTRFVQQVLINQG